MLRQHQDSLLPRSAQGEAGYEISTLYPYLVRINRVFNAVDIHVSHPEIALRNPLQRRIQGGGGFHGLRIQR